MKKIAVLFFGLIIAGLGFLLYRSGRTVIAADPPVRMIGNSTQIKIQLTNPHGIRKARAVLEQNGKQYTVLEQAWPATRVTFLKSKYGPTHLTFFAGKNQAVDLREGKAKLLVSVVSNDFRAAEDTAAYDVDVVLAPPTVTADGVQHYINQGGSELVTFQVGGYWTESGVHCGKYTFCSFPMPGSAPDSGRRFSLFAYPWDLPEDVKCVVYARNPAGTEATAQFWQKLFPKKFRTRDLDISDAFLQKVVPEIDPTGSGDLLTRFLKINGEMRRANNQRLADLRFKSEEKFLWTGPFRQLGNSKVESLFADTRNYIYNGKRVDQQTHLGFDLSVTKNVPVAAGNSGRVLLAERLGIYGNCIVIDHGYGLQSIYAHLSEIGVKPGDMVQKDQIIAKSGATGLAGGDHLHFGMQLDGVQINSVEWWDEHWIHDRILSKVQ